MIHLVTGASGFLGATLTRRLISDGEQVRVLLRRTSPLDLLQPVRDQIDIRHGDVGDPLALRAAFDGVDRIFHCAARVGFAGRRDAGRMDDVNVRGTALVTDAALEAGVSRLVHVSSIAALSRPETSEGCLDETAAWSDSRFNTAYGRSKYRSELEVYRAIAEGLDAVIVNPSLIFGPGRRGQNTMRIVETVRAGRLRRYPTGGTNVVDVDDVVTGMIAAMKRGESGRRYILGGENLSWQTIFEVLSDALGVDRPLGPISPTLLTLFAAASEAWAALSRQEPGLTRESARLSSATTCFENERARIELGWTPRPFSETAARLAVYLSR